MTDTHDTDREEPPGTADRGLSPATNGGNGPTATSERGDCHRQTGAKRRDRPDVVLVTVDAWRYDAPDLMGEFRDLAAREGYDRSEAITGSAATHGAFPPLLASQHLVSAYGPDGGVRDGVTTLPEVLAEHGYATGGFVASNPFLAKWVPYFDRFWNDGMTDSVEYSGARYSTFDRAQRFLRLRQRVTAREVADRAQRWYRTRESPRFLWLHLMDVHGPYFPGLRGARKVGLAETYRTLFDYHVRGDSSPEVLASLRTLYEQCVARLDARLASVLDVFGPETVVVVTGDHGEEFDHGFHGHAQLYDECVRTPFFARNLEGPIADSTVRHLDLAPSVLETLGIAAPSDWEGRPVDGSPRTAVMCNHAPLLDRTFVGVRTDRYKFVKSFDDERWTVENRELYDLRTDPGERHPVDAPAVASDLEATVDAFLDRGDVDLGVIRETNTGIDGDVEDRLEELGYV